MKSYEDLEIYKIALELAVKVYLLTKGFPKEEMYGIVSQIRRAVASVGANIAEGFGRFHYKDKLMFFYNARGSLYETKHFIDLSLRLEYIHQEDREKLSEEIDRLAVKLNNFIAAIGKNGDIN